MIESRSVDASGWNASERGQERGAEKVKRKPLHAMDILIIMIVVVALGLHMYIKLTKLYILNTHP
jgi:hypothetical protein